MVDDVLEQVGPNNQKLSQKLKNLKIIPFEAMQRENNVDHSLSITSICMLVTTRWRAA
jgi:hypothetical protein